MLTHVHCTDQWFSWCVHVLIIFWFCSLMFVTVILLAYSCPLLVPNTLFKAHFKNLSFRFSVWDKTPDTLVFLSDIFKVNRMASGSTHFCLNAGLPPSLWFNNIPPCICAYTPIFFYFSFVFLRQVLLCSPAWNSLSIHRVSSSLIHHPFAEPRVIWSRFPFAWRAFVNIFLPCKTYEPTGDGFFKSVWKLLIEP